MAIALICVLAVIVVLAVIIAVRTLAFSSRKATAEKQVSYPTDPNIIAQHLSGALKFKTIWDLDLTKIDYTEFQGLKDYFEKTYPLVNSKLEKHVINDYGLLYVWHGSDSSKKPILIMAHQDVVPAPVEGWTHDPFSGDIADGYIWGRGAIDDKGSLIGMLEAAEYLLKDGFQPTRTLYIASGCDEECTGMQGAGKIAQYLRDQGIQFEAIQDEGTIVSKGALPGVSQPVALIGTAEKGYLSIELIAQSQGGHSSVPPKQTNVGIIAAAVNELEENPFPTHLMGPSAGLFEYVGPKMSLPYKILFANRWLFGPLIRQQLALQPVTAASIRTTTAPDMFQGSPADNVMPSKATAVINFRILPGDSIKYVIDRVTAIINDQRVTVRPITEFSREPLPISSADTWSYRMISKTYLEIMPDVITAPFIMVGGTDSAKYADMSPNVFRTLPQRLYGDDVNLLHGINEKISLANMNEMVNWYIRLVHNLCG